MANEFNRNLQDAAVTPAAFTLHNGAGADSSPVIDLGGDTTVRKPENVELELAVPALNATMVPDTRTVLYEIQTSTTSAFSAVARTISYNLVTASGGTGSAARAFRVRLPSNCERYVRATVTMGASTGDASSISATLKVLF